MASTVSVFRPCSAVIVTVLVTVPTWAMTFIFTGMRPVPCAGTFHGRSGNSAVVQPHDELTAQMVNALDEIFVKSNSKRASGSPWRTLTTFFSLSNARTPAGSTFVIAGV